nr:hypothetical protein [Desulfobacterales bacterium]
MGRIRLVSSDLNGTLVHQHTMKDMIRLYFPDEPERYEKANSAFKKQTEGHLSMKEVFAIAGPLTRGITLRQAIMYAINEMRYVNGFKTLIDTLAKANIFFVINSTGYTITIEVIRAVYGSDKIYGAICNNLIFGRYGRPEWRISDFELTLLINEYIWNPEKRREKIYDLVRATGEIELGIADEHAKAELIFAKAKKLGIEPDQVAHIGDTMGDSMGLYGVAKKGGLGVAFNYNDALEEFLIKRLEDEYIPGRIIFIDKKGEDSNLEKVLPYLLA